MSTFTNYEITSSSYDVGRRPVGADVTAALLQLHVGKPLQALHVLDAGCGTGNYSRALLDLGLGRVTLLDASEGMLRAAKVKVGQDARVSIQRANLPYMPFGDSVFDAVMFNQVLHHLDNGSADDRYPQVKTALTEAFRVIRPGGAVIITTSLPEQILNAYWYYQLRPEIAHRYSKRFPNISVIKEMLTNAKLTLKLSFSVLGTDWFEQYGDPEGPLREEWRNNDSFWSLAREHELEEVLIKIGTLKEAGKLEEFVKQHDKSDTFGCFTFLMAIKTR